MQKSLKSQKLPTIPDVMKHLWKNVAHIQEPKCASMSKRQNFAVPTVEKLDWF